MLWLKALHIIAMVAWFSGIFYLPRLFVYHATCKDVVGNQRFKIMERRLYYGITTPSALLTLLCGIWITCLNPHFYLTAGWFHAKLGLVLILIAYHVYCGILLRRFAFDANQHSALFYRWFNEFPVLLLVAIVMLVVIKPF